jgi:glycosyltransferase involved in cell wall biosynthesis
MSATALPRVLVLTSTWPRWSDDTDPRFIEYLSYELARSFDVTVLAPHCSGAALQEQASNGEQTVDVHRFRYFFTAMQSLAYGGGMLAQVRRNPFRLLLLPFFLVAELVAIARLHREHQFDAIHAHWIVPHGLVAAVYRLISRNAPPILVTSHGGDLYALRGFVMRRLKRWILNRASAVTVVSEAMRGHCADLGFDADKIVVRSMGVDLKDTFTPGARDGKRSGLVFVGRLVEKKGVEYLIEAMAVLMRREPKPELSIVGGGPLLSELQQLSERCGVAEQVRFVGSVPNVVVPDYLRASSIAVMPSIVAASGDQEGLGLVAVEAMGCECAVVASDLPAVRDVVRDGETGLMAEPANADALAAAITRLLDDDDLRRGLAEKGRRYATENFDWRIVGRRYAELLSELQRQ